ncbi:hypothetical protein KUCAC02_030198 [Chaenocephalus aceratus]|uniref:Uncharacterized protein n=1 Tax=Chaenocephalus aceratus TaxID=36190 RepID=A0ACB9XI20_CHAAC|nr:hypothetical protein KUCAC02_030198 [Chaenocephalus aceratus]
MLRSLKKRGNFDHNATVASCGAGEMVAMQEIAYGDMLKTALRSLMRESLKVGENGSTLIYQNLIQFRKQFGRLPVK